MVTLEANKGHWPYFYETLFMNRFNPKTIQSIMKWWFTCYSILFLLHCSIFHIPWTKENLYTQSIYKPSQMGNYQRCRDLNGLSIVNTTIPYQYYVHLREKEQTIYGTKTYLCININQMFKLWLPCLNDSFKNHKSKDFFIKK